MENGSFREFCEQLENDEDAENGRRRLNRAAPRREQSPDATAEIRLKLVAR
jgi:hypothetical protein